MELQTNLSSSDDNASRLKAIFESAIDGILTIDERGVVESINPAAARLFGYEPQEVIGQNVSMLMPAPHKEQHDGYISNYLRTGEAAIIGIGREVTGLKRNGEVFPFRLAISEVFLDDRRIFTGFVHDLTAQKQAENQLRRYAAELERSNKELQDFAYISSHDLQEPLRKIRAFGSRIKLKEGHKLSEQGADYLDRMTNAAERLQNLINDLLGYSRVSTKARHFSRVNLNEILKEVQDDLEISITQADAQIEVKPLPQIEADPIQMRLLFQNLLGNALKFRKEGQAPFIRVYAQEPVLDSEKEFVEIHVGDNGIGFDEKYLDRLFQIFQRLEGQRYLGSGVGLAICKKIVVLHGGEITARSTTGEGATFVITLPFRQNING